MTPQAMGIVEWAQGYRNAQTPTGNRARAILSMYEALKDCTALLNSVEPEGAHAGLFIAMRERVAAALVRAEGK